MLPVAKLSDVGLMLLFLQGWGGVGWGDGGVGSAHISLQEVKQ